MFDYFSVTLADSPVTCARTGRSDTELSVDTPWLRVSLIIRMVEDRDMSKIIPSFDLHSNVDPQRGLSFSFFVTLTCGIDYSPFDPLLPRHAQKQSSIII